MTSRHVRQRYINPGRLGVSAATMGDPVTSTAFDTTGYNQISIDVDYTYGSASALTIYLEVADHFDYSTNGASSATWRRLQTGSISSGTVTVSNAIYSNAVSDDENFQLQLPINNVGMARLVFDGTSDDATDIITAAVHLGNV